MTGRKTQKARENNYGLYEQFTGILHKTQPEPLRAADALHRPHHAPLCGRTMLCGNTGEYLPAGFQTGKLQLRYRRGWQNRNVCRGKEPLLVFFFQCKRPEPYAFKDVVYQKLITLCADICKRNGKKKLLWLGDKDKTLSYEPKSDEMVLTVHRWFANKSCPGNWMYARMGDLAEKVTAQLGGGISGNTETEHPEKLTEGYYRVRKTWADSKTQKGAYKILSNAKRCADSNPGYSVFDDNGVNIYSPGGAASAPSEDVPFLVQVSISDLNIRKGPGTDYAKTGKFTGKGVFTIMEVKSGQGSTAGWGRLKSGAGWISLDYTSKIK